MMKQHLLGFVVALSMVPVACGSETTNPTGITSTTAAVSVTTTAPAPFKLASLTSEGGCGRNVHLANKSWTQVIQFRIGRVGDFEPGVPIEFQVGDGVSVDLSVGEHMSNLFCNDIIEGNERIDSVYAATSGTVLVTLDAPYEDNVRVMATVIAADLVFETDPSVTVESLTATAAIGWFPG